MKMTDQLILNRIVKLSCILMLSTVAWATPPGLAPDPNADASTTNTAPPSWYAFQPELTQSFRQQGLSAVPRPQLAPGVFVESAEQNVHLRVPIFLVMVPNTPNKEALISHTRSAFFGQRGLKSFMDQLMTGRGTYLHEEDFFPVTLTQPWTTYLTDNQPKKVGQSWPLFDAISASLQSQGSQIIKSNYIAISPSTGERLSRGRNGVPNPSSGTIDGCILVLAIEGQTIAYRWWMGNDQGQEPVITAANGESFKVDSYIAIAAYSHFSQQHAAANIPFHPGFLHHEYLHLLKVPDLYDRDQNSMGCGCWCTMGWGMYGPKYKEETMPVWPSAWVRHFLNPVGEVSVSQGEAKTTQRRQTLAHALADGPGNKIVKLPITVSPHERYLLVELRGDSIDDDFVWDEPALKRGFLIWDVEESVGKASPDWPVDLGGGHQNDTNDNPLVALVPRRYQSGSTPTQIKRRNLESSDAVRNISELAIWHDPTSSLQHSSGWTLSNFNPEEGTFEVKYTGQVIAQATPPPQEAMAAPAPAPPPPAQSAPVQTFTGRANEVTKELPEHVQERLQQFLTYNSVKQHILTEGDQKIAITGELSTQKAQASQTLSSLINMLPSALGEEVNQVRTQASQRIGPKTAADLRDRLLNKAETIVVHPYITLAGQPIKVTGAPVLIEQQSLPDEPDDKNAVRLTLPPEIQVPNREAAEEALRTGSYLSKTEVFEALQEKKLEPQNESQWQLTVESQSGRLLWEGNARFADGTTQTLHVPALMQP